MSFEPELDKLDAGLHDTYVSLEKVAGAGKNVSESMRGSIRTFQAASGKAKELAESYEKAVEASKRIADSVVRHEQVSLKLVLQYHKHIKSVKDLSNEYKKLEVVQKALDISSRGTLENVQKSISGLSKLSRGAVGLASSVGGLALSHTHLRDSLVNYNKTQFEAMRLGERYGDSLESHAEALKMVAEKTAFSKQEFADLNLTVKQMSIGIPMTEKEVAKFASTLSDQLGYSVERVNKAFTQMLQLQDRIPDITDRVQSIREEFQTSIEKGTVSAKALRDEMRAVGASQSDIDNAMSMVRNVSPDSNKLLGFEKVIAQAKRDLTDSSLEISEKMQPGLEGLAKTQAEIAKSIAGMRSELMLGIGAFSMMGAAAASLLSTMISIGTMTKTIGGLGGGQLIAGLKNLFKGKSATAAMSGAKNLVTNGLKTSSLAANGARVYEATASGGVPGSVSSLTGRMAVSESGKLAANGGSLASKVAWGGSRLAGGLALGGLVLNQVGEHIDKSDWINKYETKSDSDNTLSKRKAVSKGLSASGIGVGIGATAGFVIGNLIVPGVGGVVGAKLGAVGGGALGAAYGGWKGSQEGARMAQEQMTQKKDSSFADMIRSTGLNIKKGSSKKEVIESITENLKDEENKQKSINALQAAYASRQMSIGEIQRVFNAKLGNSKKAWEETRKIVAEVNVGLKDQFNVQSQIERAMDAQLSGLRAQLVIIEAIKSAGSSAVAGLAEGKVGSEAGALGGQVALTSAKESTAAKQRVFASEYLRAQSDTKAVQDLLGPLGAKQLAEDNAKATQIGTDIERQKFDKETALKNADKLSPKEKKEQVAQINKAYDEAVAELTKQLEDVKKNIADSLKNVDIKQALDVANPGYKKLVEEYKKLQDSGAGEEQLKPLRAKIKTLAPAKTESDLAYSQQLDVQYETATAQPQRDLDLTKRQLGLAEARAAQASKMGLPQSYEAQQGVIKLAQQQRINAMKLMAASNAQAQDLKSSGIDIVAINAGKASKEDAVAKMMKQDSNLTKNDAEVRLQKILDQRIKTEMEVVAAGDKLAEATKTWREGWMDAMDELVIGAGDFAAVIGIGNKNVGEKMAAGGVSTNRYGGTNANNMNQADLFAARTQNATSFTADQNKVFGTSALGQSMLQKHSNMMDDPSGDPTKAIKTADLLATKGVVTIREDENSAIQATRDSQTAQMVNANANGAQAFRKPTPADISTKSYISAGVAYPGTDTPGGSKSDGIYSPFLDVLVSGTRAAMDDIQKSKPNANESNKTKETKVVIDLTPNASQWFKWIATSNAILDNGTSLAN